MTATAAQPDAGASPRLKRRPRWWSVLLILLAVLVALFAIYRIALHYRLSSELAALRAAGYPTNLEELNEWLGPPPPDDENGARLYRLAFERYADAPDEDHDYLPLVGRRFGGTLEPEDRLTDRMLRAVTDHVERNAESLELLHRAAEFPRVRLTEVVLSDPRQTLRQELSQTSSLRRMNKLLAVEAMLHTEQDDAERAVLALYALWRSAEALADEPFWVANFSRVASRGFMVEQLERALHYTRFTDEQLIMLMDALTEEDTSAWRRSLISDRARDLPNFYVEQYWRMPFAEELADWGMGLPAMGLLRLIGLPDFEMLDHLAHLDALIEGAAHAYPQRLDTVLLATGGYPIFHEALALARMRSARAALAVERYRLAHGTLPESLADLTPDFIEAVPLDPFTGEPLKYARLDAGYTIYSVGEDRIDHGGARSPADGQKVGPGADIPFSVRRQPPDH